MARQFAVSDAGVTIESGDITLVFINNDAAPAQTLEFLRAWVGQSANATSAQQRVELATQVTAFPTLTSATPQALNFGEAVSNIVGGTAGAAGTAGTDASAEGGGSVVSMWEDAFNVLNGWLWVPTPNEVIRIRAGESSGFGLRMPVAAGTLTNWAFGLVFGEV
jgi:hypothetical protein